MQDLNALAAALAGAHHDPGARVPAAHLAALTRDDALAVQAAVARQVGGATRVAKVAVPADGVAVGAPIPAAWTIAAGETMALGGRDFAGLEIEIAAHLAADLTPEIAARGTDAVRAAIDHFVVGVELIGSRIDDRTAAGPFGPLADLMVTGGYVLGAETLAAEPAVAGLPVTLTVDGRVVQSEVAAYPFGDALAPIRAFAAKPVGGLDGLRKGMVVTTGSLTPLLIAPRGGDIRITLGDLPPIAFTLRS